MMRRSESEAEKRAKRERAIQNIKDNPPEKGDFLAMVIAAFIVLLPVFLLIVGVFVIIIVILFL